MKALNKSWLVYCKRDEHLRLIDFLKACHYNFCIPFQSDIDEGNCWKPVGFSTLVIFFSSPHESYHDVPVKKELHRVWIGEDEEDQTVGLESEESVDIVFRTTDDLINYHFEGANED